MLVLKFTCDNRHHLNTDLIMDKFHEAIGKQQNVTLKSGPDVVKLYLGEKSSKNIK